MLAALGTMVVVAGALRFAASVAVADTDARRRSLFLLVGGAIVVVLPL